MSLTATSALLSLSGLSGWSAGLTWHARTTAGWKDPGARLAWTSGVGLLIAICAMGALLLVISRALLWLPAALLVAAVSARGAWWACQHTAGPDAGERRDRRTGLRWEIPALIRGAAAHRRRARLVGGRLTRRLKRVEQHSQPARTHPSPGADGAEAADGAGNDRQPRRQRDHVGAARLRAPGRQVRTAALRLVPTRNRKGGMQAVTSDNGHHGDSDAKAPPPGR